MPSRPRANGTTARRNCLPRPLSCPNPTRSQRLLKYLSFRKELLAGEIWEWSCYAGTTIQETHETYPAIRDACARSITTHVAMLRTMVDDVLREHPVPNLRADSLAMYLQAVIQGAFIMAKANQDVQSARDAIDHLHRYVELLFSQSTNKKHKR